MIDKRKIFNDPVYGFVNIKSSLVFQLIEHPFFQRLRRIKQLGLTDLIYPGALHTRFHHALGAMHLMSQALDNLILKGKDISPKEYEAALIATLLHDIGHGPFSHTLEEAIIPQVKHEIISKILIQKLNEEFDGKLDMACDIFSGTYKRIFLNQLVSSQLDIDRLDYLKRDSFFTGVSEGSIGTNRIIKMLDVVDDQIVVEEKGIYSVENFLTARRLMYWQVYLHKTTVCAEKMLDQTIRRAKTLSKEGHNLNISEHFKFFLENDITLEKFEQSDVLWMFTQLDDFDIWSAVKRWCQDKDKILSYLATSLINRKLFKIKLSNSDFKKAKLKKVRLLIQKHFHISKTDLSYFMLQGQISNDAYISSDPRILILTKKGELKDISEASDLPNIKAMSHVVKKNYLCWPKGLS